jgi:shikimate dehydrogenase
MIHSYLGSYSYELFDTTPDQLDAFLKSTDFSGINVTIPYKKSVLPYCKELSDTAQKLGAVNTVIRQKDGSLIGHSTDYFGFQYMLKKSSISVADRKVLVLGSGGASNTVCCVLQELGAHVVVISRSGVNHYGNLHIHADASLIVNTTPVGMYPNTLISPVDLSLFPNLEGVLDLVYNPARTKILLDAECRGLQSMNGLIMLVAQAKESAQWFTGVEMEDQIIEKIHKAEAQKISDV